MTIKTINGVAIAAVKTINSIARASVKSWGGEGVITVPDAPTIGTATAGDASATVAFTDNGNGGSAITGHTAISTPGGHTGTGASPITVAGLTNGTAYTFTVHATNAIGDSAESAASNSVTPSAAPVYATWDSANKGTACTLSGGDLTAAFSNSSIVRATVGKSAGKWSWEVTVDSGTAIMIGIATSAAAISSYLGIDAYGWAYYSNNGNKFNAGSNSAWGASYTTAAVIRCELNMDSGQLEIFKNNVSQGTITGLSGTIYPAVGSGGSAGQTTTNFGTTTFVNAPTSGFNTGIYT